MGKILLKHPGAKSAKKYQEDVARMVQITITVKSSASSNIKMISVRELHSNDNYSSGNKHKTVSV